MQYISMQSSSFAIVFASSLIVSACTVDGDWPNLSDPLPEVETAPHMRVIPAPAEPVAAPLEADTDNLANPESWLAETEALFADALANYHQSVTAFETAEETEKEIAWRSAQTALTKLSQIAGRLSSLLFEKDLPEAISERTRSLHQDYQRLLSRERNRLENLR